MAIVTVFLCFFGRTVVCVSSLFVVFFWWLGYAMRANKGDGVLPSSFGY
jgi:hypothetical protein